jgi:tripeptide aminopeptidase
MNHNVLERFLRYVTYDTQSDPHSPTQPSTEKQKLLGALLAQELRELGAEDAHLDEFGYVYATIPSTTTKDVPVLCFCSHLDTALECSGFNVKPIVHRNYQGQDLVLPDDHNVVIRLTDFPDLQQEIGYDIVTASGTTLLGADNKSGIATIMDAAAHLLANPEIPHGKIRILFTPDEEIGRGVDKVDMKKLGADFGYTLDGEKRGSVEDETFSADGAVIKIQGISAHPGMAKGKMESALKIAAEFVAGLPKDQLSPESTEEKQGFVHPTSIQGSVEAAEIHFIVRDFTDEKLLEHEAFLQLHLEKVLQHYPHSRGILEVKPQYRNMKKILDQHPQVMDYALEAIKRVGITPIQSSIRGGTDGSRLSFMGLPCPNIFTGEHSFHAKTEWASVYEMEKAAEIVVELAKIWAEKE